MKVSLATQGYELFQISYITQIHIIGITKTILMTFVQLLGWIHWMNKLSIIHQLRKALMFILRKTRRNSTIWLYIIQHKQSLIK